MRFNKTKMSRHQAIFELRFSENANNPSHFVGKKALGLTFLFKPAQQEEMNLSNSYFKQAQGKKGKITGIYKH